MACITLEGPEGKRTVPENHPYRKMPGEKITGVVWDCGYSADQDQVNQELERHGLKLGDAISWATTRLGIKKCASCAARQEILNAARDLGWAETIKQIRETFKCSTTDKNINA